ncbi:MAG: homogentisate 1,2-dioxygenase domain-containing protein [Terriglobales bacterium]
MDAKAVGFVPGGASLHNCMAGHGTIATIRLFGSCFLL